MGVAKVAISINEGLLQKLDDYVNRNIFKNRSQAIQLAISKTIEHLEHSRLERECKKLNVHTEQTMADEGLKQDLDEWQEF